VAPGEAAPVPQQGAALTPSGARRRPLARSFYARAAPIVARDLLGRELVRTLDGALLVARIVETEAYQEDDPASHSFRGRTARTDVMFGPPGHLYVYFSYGMHWCMNVVTGRHGEGSAVLLRAAEPLAGVDVMRSRRTVQPERLLCAGPGRLTQAFGVDRTLNGVDLVSGVDVWISTGRPLADGSVDVSRRVGISVARERPWRYAESGSVFVSRRPRATTGSVTASAAGSASVGVRSRSEKARATDSGTASGSASVSVPSGRREA